MLTSLYVENFAIVSHLELDFSEKMSAFTGETGAGKSIMIDALMLALGERADASVVRNGALKCEIQACFTASPDSTTYKWFKEHDVSIEDDEIYLRRVIFAEGRSKSYINGIPFSLQKVKELSETLVDIHGQHQHQTLLNHQTHRKQLDEYAGHTELLSKTQAQYSTCQQLKQKLAALDLPKADDEKATLLQYQIDELNQLELMDGEIEALYNEQKLLHHAKEYLQSIQVITELLGNDNTPSISDFLNNTLQQLQALPAEDKHIETAVELINNALIQCDEALSEVSNFAAKVQLDPERLSIVEARMAELHNVARKYHVDVHNLADKINELQAAQQEVTANKQQEQLLTAQLADASAAYQQAAENLTASRVKAAKLLGKEITEVIQKLGMPKGFVEVAITSLDKMQAHGLDKVEYKVCTNPGMRPDSLNKIISGGELSRISLAIQMITAKRSATPTLFFDEVDVGIGGATAALVGKLLRNLGERLQIFCVTHQPQVAASAHNHFLVAKEVQNKQTFTNIKLLTKDEKVNELARMLGGIEITEQTKLHAQEMLED